MRSILITTMAVAAFCVATACQQESMPESSRSHVRKITVHANQADTRTEITYDEAAQKYKSIWEDGDWIDLFEFSSDEYNVGNSQDDCPEDYERRETFTVSFEDDPLEGELQYVGVYPGDNVQPDQRGVVHSGSEGAFWSSIWGAAPDTPRWGLIGTIPWNQHPNKLSFDPQADLLFSEMKSCNLNKEEDESGYQTGDIALTFARVGSIAKITLTNLPVGEEVTVGTFTHGSSWRSTGQVLYDPIEKKVGILPESDQEASGSTIEFSYQGFYVNDSREADIWLRVLTGTLSDGFTIRVTTYDSDYNPRYFKKTVTLNTPITFTEGDITAFSVKVFELGDY